jgi:hypothetical protein
MLTYYSLLHYYSAWRQLIARRLIHPFRLQLRRRYFRLRIRLSLRLLQHRGNLLPAPPLSLRSRQLLANPLLLRIYRPELRLARLTQLQAKRLELASILRKRP